MDALDALIDKIRRGDRRSLAYAMSLVDEAGQEGVPPEVVGVEAKSGKGVDQLLDKLLELDRAARQPQQRQRHRQRQVLGEIRHSTMLVCKQALEDRLAAPATKELIARLERGELSLDQVARELSVIGHQSSVISRQLSVEEGPPESCD